MSIFASAIQQGFNPKKTSKNAFLWINAKQGVSQTAGVITAVSDLSGNGYNLTPSHSPTWSASALGPNKPGMIFNGVNQNLVRNATIGGNKNLFSMWGVFKRTAGTAYHAMSYMPSTSDWSGNTNDIYVCDAETNAASAMGIWDIGVNIKAESAAGTFPLSEFIEICVTYDGTTLKLFRNNTLVGSSAVSGLTLGNKIMIGGLGNDQTNGYPGYNWNGVIGELVWFDGELTATDRANLHKYGQYHWNDIYQANQSSYGFNGSTYWTGGVGPYNFNYTQPFSISAWVRPDASRPDKISICAREDIPLGITPYRGWDFMVEFDRTVSLYMGNSFSVGVYSKSVGQVVCDGVTWTHIGCTNDGSGTDAGIKLYINGVLQTNASPIMNNLAGNTIQSVAPFLIGEAYINGTTGFLGGINNLSIWDKTLSGAEFSAIYNNHTPNDISTLGISNLSGWWGMALGNDSLTVINDRAGSTDMSVYAGTPVIVANVPLPFK